MDDFIHWSILAEPSEIPEQLHATGLVPENPGSLPTALFHQFGVSRDKERIKKWINYGVLPWWISENIQGGLWRPLTSLTHWLDYRLFPNSSALMHAHNITWFSAAIFVVAVLYRRLIGPNWLAALAAVMYLLDENSYFPTSFIANRNALTAIFFGMLALLAHHRWRTTNSISAAFFAQVCLLLSLLSGEAGVATFAYLFAYAVALEEGSLHRRIVSLAPAVSVIVLWRLIYNALGYGISGVGLYVDPVNNPIRYALAVVERAPILLMGQLSWQSPDFLMGTSDSVRAWAWLFSLVFLVLVCILLIPLLRKSRLARFWFIAMIVSVLPFCAVFPSGRTLLFTGIAAFGLIATFFSSLLTKEKWISKSRPYRVAAWTLCMILLLVHLPMAAVGRAVTPKMSSFFTDALGLVMRISLPQAIENKDVVIVNTPNPLVLAHLPFLYAYEGQLLPRTIRTLVPGLRPLTIRRTGPNTLVVRANGGDIFSCEQHSPLHFVHVFKTFNELFRAGRPAQRAGWDQTPLRRAAPDLPKGMAKPKTRLRRDQFAFRVKDKVILPRLTIEVTAIDQEAMPTEVSFTFAASLEDPSLCWYQFDWFRLSYAPFSVPSISEQTEIAGPLQVSFSDSIKYMMSVLFQR